MFAALSLSGLFFWNINLNSPSGQTDRQTEQANRLTDYSRMLTRHVRRSRSCLRLRRRRRPLPTRRDGLIAVAEQCQRAT